MPTTPVITYFPGGILPLMDSDDAFEQQIPVLIPASSTLAAGTVMGEITATPGTYAPYNSAHTDGTQNPAGILQYPVTTDASGHITNIGDYGYGLTTPLYTKGTFSIADLVGLDANAVTKLSGLIVEGSIASAKGIFRF